MQQFKFTDRFGTTYTFDRENEDNFRYTITECDGRENTSLISHLKARQFINDFVWKAF